MNSGLYVLKINLPESTTLKVGSKGNYFFPAGTYVYIGSAKNNLNARIKRHKSKIKKLHWHIDYFLQCSEIINVKKFETPDFSECDLAQKYEEKGTIIMPGFGSSDCNCKTHLFKVE